MSGMRTVSFLGPEGGESGAGATEAANGVETGGGFGGWKNCVAARSWATGFEVACGSVEGRKDGPTSGSRLGNWIRTVSRDFVFGSGDFPAGDGGKSMRTVSFFGSFAAAIERNRVTKFA